MDTYTNIPNNVIEFLLASHISKTALKLYLCLRMHKNNGTGKTWIGVRRAIREAHISNRDVKPARAELEKLGVIHSEQRLGMSNMITFNDEVMFIVNNSTDVHSEVQGDVHNEQHTITSTNTNLTNTNPLDLEVQEKNTPSLLEATPPISVINLDKEEAVNNSSIHAISKSIPASREELIRRAGVLLESGKLSFGQSYNLKVNLDSASTSYLEGLVGRLELAVN